MGEEEERWDSELTTVARCSMMSSSATRKEFSTGAQEQINSRER